MGDYETIRRLKNHWMVIQEIRSQREIAIKKMHHYQKQVRELSQKIPKMLDDFNKVMV